MRVLHLVHQYLPEKSGGTELYTHWLSDALSRQGHQVAVFYRRNEAGVGVTLRTENEVGVWATWHDSLDPARRLLATFGDRPVEQAFAGVLAEIEPDVVHVQHLMGLPAALLGQLRQRQIPYVMTLWDFWWVCANAQLLTNYSQELCDGPQAFLNCARCALARSGRGQLWPALPLLAGPLAWRNQTLRQAVAGATRLIAPADFVRDWYGTHGLPAGKIVALPPGLDYPQLLPKTDQELGRPFRVGYVGGLSWQKGVHVLVEAFRQVDGPAELWIAGDTAFDPAYTNRLRQAADNRVRFLGQVNRDELWPMLAGLDVVVVPSLWYETFCFVVSEAFAAGLPVIASNLGVLAERVRDGVDGLLFPPGDTAALGHALGQLQRHPERLAQLGAGIRPPATMAEHTRDVVALYEQAIRSSKSAF
ncbi:MAG: glycosyltransferase family 4 protein [Chloroflexi bacterium]|nr:glycosyltransferase family 4 protein [Chloroflexota bacterium]MCI0576590.1 glycosyltransferase family 4 protein [Chloroflexota bacterium]MCI0647384.1 glycosyltransferase family 4 protein [Chloroflexota bacterium]MCI0728278.1 glycosyltransferase family 4 protein [Chloroflexota bacterium]